MYVQVHVCVCMYVCVACCCHGVALSFLSRCLHLAESCVPYRALQPFHHQQQQQYIQRKRNTQLLLKSTTTTTPRDILPYNTNTSAAVSHSHTHIHKVNFRGNDLLLRDQLLSHGANDTNLSPLAK